MFTHLFIFRRKIKQLGTAMLCPWRGSCKLESACKASLPRLNWKWTWDCGHFPAECTPSRKESWVWKGNRPFFSGWSYQGALFWWNKRFLLNLCFYKTLNNSTDMKRCHLVRPAGTLKQIFANRMFWCYQGKITQDFSFIGNFNLFSSFR